MSYRDVLAFAATLEKEGLVSDATIGGSVAVILHAEPIYTDDLDFFIHLEKSGPVLDLGPIFRRATEAGASVAGEYLCFGPSKFQFIVAATPLEEEAMRSAQMISAWGIDFRVFSAEHIIALKLAAFRPKDRVHIAHLLRTAREPVDLAKLEALLARHGLTARWQELRREAGL